MPTHQGETQVKLILPALYSQISSVQNCKKMNECLLLSPSLPPAPAFHFVITPQPREYGVIYIIHMDLLTVS